MTYGLGSECPEFDECGNYLHTTELPWIDECDWHGRFKGYVNSNLGYYEYEWIDG